MALSDLLATYRTHRDRLDEVLAEEKAIREQMEAVESDIRSAMSAAGLESAKGGGMSVTATTKWRARYDPEKWAQVVAWCVAQGRPDLVQRRLNDAKIMELVDSGVGLPEGLNVESFPDLLFRRVGG